MPTKPSTGDVIIVLDSLIFSSSRRALLLELRLARSCCATRRLVRASVSSKVCFGSSCRSSRLLFRSRFVSRQLQVGIALTDRCLADPVGGFRLTHLLLDFPVLDLRHGLPPPHRVAELHVDLCEAPVDSARPAPSPRQSGCPRRALLGQPAPASPSANSTGIGGRPARPPAPPRAPPPAAGAVAPVAAALPSSLLQAGAMPSAAPTTRKSRALRMSTRQTQRMDVTVRDVPASWER